MDQIYAMITRSYAIELTIQLAALVALVSGAMFLRRRGMLELAVSWAMLTAASAGTLAALLLRGTQYAGLEAALILFTFPVVVGSQLVQRRLAIVLSDNVAPPPLLRTVLQSMAIGLSVSLVMVGLRTVLVGEQRLTILLGRLVTVSVGVMVVVAAWRGARRATAHRDVVLLLGVNAAVGTLRVILRTIIDIDARRATPALPLESGLIVSVAQQSIAVVAFVAMLVLLERDAMRQQIENLRRAELELAASRRLESLGKMASSIAHDFNTVLTILMHGLDEAQEPDAESRAAGLRDARDAAERGRSLTKRLLDFARDRPRTPALFDPARRVQANADVWRHMVRAPASITVQSADAVPMLLMDPVQFDQLLLNLIGNAADAIDERGSIRVVCDAVTFDRSQEVLGGTIPPGAYCRLVVTDDGAGMSAETTRLAFEPFFTTKGSGGTGLGLATVLAITTSVSGGVIVESAPKAGATFTVLLPAARRAARDN